jgi:nitroimidazol reductase NimA-like FMN-containing flavoprotein (pyridoxamine 5'-phosphate oxidase superfamily)
MSRELSSVECDDLLRRHRVGHLGVRDAQGVYIVPVSYAFENGAVYAHAPFGRKIALMRRWPHVAFQVDEVEDSGHWRSVLVRGRFEELQEAEMQAHARLLLVRAFEGNPMSVTAGHGHQVHLADAIMFRIRIREMTGRSEGL